MSEVVHIYVSDLRPVTDGRSHQGLHDLIKSILRLWTIIDNSDRRFRCAISGGAVARALLGLDTSQCDLDLFVPEEHVAAIERSLVSAGGVPARFDGSDSERPVYTVPELGRVDLVGCPSVALALARFDIRACAVATDGRILMAAQGALEDILDRKLHVRRETTRERIAKYLGMGLDLDLSTTGYRGAERRAVTADELVGESDVPGWTNSYLKREEFLGCTLDVDVKMVDLRRAAS
jgi:hypothetical protein